MLGTITLTVGQPDGVSVAQKEEAPETMETAEDEAIPQVNGDKVEKDSPDATDIATVEEKAAEEKPDDASEVGFKKIFRFVGFKFTLKKDKSEEKDPVKLLTVKDKEGEEVSGTDTPADAHEEAATADEEDTSEENVADTEASTTEAEDIKDTEKPETTDVPTEGTTGETTAQEIKEEGAEKESETTPPSQETVQSPFRKFFTGGLFSNLRKKASIKKPKEEEEKEVAVVEETTKTEETADAVVEEEGKVEVEQESKDQTDTSPEEAKSDLTPEPEVTVETPASTATTTDENKPEEEEKEEATAEEEKVQLEVSSEAELVSSQEKAKVQGSPLKKLFTGAGLKKLSTKKQKSKKDTETKLTESGEQAAEQLQSSTESTEGPKPDSGASSPEESGEHVIAVEVPQVETSQEPEGEVASDGEKKKEGIIAWSSFKKLVTPKKRVKRSSESEDEAMGEKPAKSATLSSTESATLADKSGEEDTREDKPTEEEPKTENTEKLVSSTEEPKKKIDTSVSWEALMCMGGAKKRTRRTSDSDDEETKIDDEMPAAVEGEQEGKNVEATIATSHEAESEGEGVSSPEPLTGSHERESAWDTLKRLVMSKNKGKAEEKTEESADQFQSDSEVSKEESSFSLRKFFPGRRKKKVDKQASVEHGSSEEDSDTPAVVPLSEYEEQAESLPAESQQDEPAEPAELVEPATVQIKVSTEDRSPSWIPASVGDVDDTHDQLSDIPEEAENAATPKSVDTDITEDETEDQPMLSPGDLGNRGRRLSTAEVKPVAPAPAAETTPVPQGPKSETAEIVVESIQAQINEVPFQTSVTVEDVPVEVATDNTENEPVIDHAESKTNTILEVHTCNEAMVICTGLGTKEITKVALEKPVTPVVECVTVIHDALDTEVLMEDKPASMEEAIATEDPVLQAQVHQVESTKLEPAVESLQSEKPEIETTTEGYEPKIEKAGEVSTFLLSEVVQPTEDKVENPITPTSESIVNSEIAEITEPAIETKEIKTEIAQLAASEEITMVKETVQVMTEEISSNICENTITEGAESDIPVAVPSEEVAVVGKTVVLVAPLGQECNQAATKEPVVEENAPLSDPGDEKQIQEQEREKEEVTVVEPAVDATFETAELDVDAVIEKTDEKTEDVKDEVEQVNVIEEQSIAIAQAVIQDAMNKVSEAPSEPKKPTTPTAHIPTPEQAIETIEKEIEMEKPIISGTPVAISCEVPAPTPKTLHVAMEIIETVPEEVTCSLDASVEEEKKPKEELKQAMEVKESEEVVLEEATELQPESQAGEEVEQVKEEQSKEETEVQEVEPADVNEKADVCEESQLETTSEAPSMEKVPEIHMSVQVVLQEAKIVEDPSVEQETAVEFDSNGPVDSNIQSEATNVKSESSASQEQGLDSLPTLLEEPQMTASAEVAAPALATETEMEKTPSKCAEVMAQVLEVIEEAVKEIEPVSTEITAAS
ncbi:hypothetical protein LDENG_00173910 [Lucifuga dentata]|nr:hypothetical protein LDENG_00173910 [Lucifuga dentata]